MTYLEKEYLRLLYPCAGFQTEKELHNYLESKYLALTELTFLEYLQKVLTSQGFFTDANFYTTPTEFEFYGIPRFEMVGITLNHLDLELSGELTFSSIFLKLKPEFEKMIKPSMILRTFLNKTFNELFDFNKIAYSTGNSDMNISLNLTNNAVVTALLEKIFSTYWEQIKECITEGLNENPEFIKVYNKLSTLEKDRLKAQLPHILMTGVVKP